MPPATEKIELTGYQQSFEEAGSPVRFTVKHTTPFGDMGGFDVKGTDFSVSEADLIQAATDAGITLDSPGAIGDAIIAYVASQHWTDPAQAGIVKATP